MKKFLQWLFREEWNKYQDQLFWDRMRRDDYDRRNWIASHALKQLGYDVILNPKFVAKEYKPDAIPDIDGSALPHSLYLIKKLENNN
jgi:hypothetical protein